jgi:peptidoglycan/LPS O-acetylase OafA/YrhL
VTTFFALPPFVLLGTFSYSLYLINDPVTSVVMHAIRNVPPVQKLALGYGVLIPLLLVVAYLFGRVFETPFVSAVRRASDSAVLHHDTPGNGAAPLVAEVPRVATVPVVAADVAVRDQKARRASADRA